MSVESAVVGKPPFQSALGSYWLSFSFSPQALMDILQQDRRESAEQRQELCDIISRLQGDLQGTEEQRDKVGLLQEAFSTFVSF